MDDNMDTKLISKIRAEVEASRLAKGNRVHHSEFIKKSGCDLLASGVNCSELSNLIGIQCSTLYKWSQIKKPVFRKLKVSTIKVIESLVVKIILPNGTRIEFPSISQLNFHPRRLLDCVSYRASAKHFDNQIQQPLERLSYGLCAGTPKNTQKTKTAKMVA
jgi:hypothetical protein